MEVAQCEGHDTLYSFNPSLSGSPGTPHLRIPRHALPHRELRTLAKSVACQQSSFKMKDWDSVLASTGSESTCVPSPGCSMPDVKAQIYGDLAYKLPPRLLSILDFKPLGHIGKGAHGRVLLVRDKTSRQELALKIVEKDTLHLTSYPRIFEEQLVGRKLLDCSWALGVEGSFQDHDYFYFLTRYHPGGDLTKLVRACGKLPFSVARQYAAELIVAVEELHNRQVMHRDIKPDNILIDEAGHLVLADFGVSRSFGDSSSSRPWEQSQRWAKYAGSGRSGILRLPPIEVARDGTCTPCGTPGFMAPETFGREHYSYGADIWSAGIVMHYLLTGRLPFGMIPAKQSYKELRARTTSLQLEFGIDERVPGYARLILRRMLEKDPSKRIALVDIKTHQFFAGVDWQAIFERRVAIESPFLISYLQHRINSRPHQDAIVLASGTPYEPGESPFPWFDCATQSLLETESPKLGNAFDADETSLQLPGTHRKASFMKRFRDLWRRNEADKPV